MRSRLPRGSFCFRECGARPGFSLEGPCEGRLCDAAGPRASVKMSASCSLGRIWFCPVPYPHKPEEHNLQSCYARNKFRGTCAAAHSQSGPCVHQTTRPFPRHFWRGAFDTPPRLGFAAGKQVGNSIVRNDIGVVWMSCEFRIGAGPGSIKKLMRIYFLSILTDTSRLRKSGTVALLADPMPSPGVMGASAIRQVCSPESRLTEVRPAQVCSAHVCSQSVRVAQIRRAQARLAPISPAEPPPTQVRPAQIGPEQRRLNQACRQSARHRPRPDQTRASSTPVAIRPVSRCPAD